MIIVPTRELAIQIDQEFRSFRGSMEIYSVCCVGGAPIGRQMSELRYHNSFVIGTPGRLKDLMQRGMIKTPQFSTIVLDEADRMLDMGFIHDMKFIMEKMPTNRHTLFFSATMDKQIEVLIKDFLHNPVTVSVKTGNTAQSVEQDIVKVLAGTNKIDVLHDLLVDKAFSKVLIFGRTKHGVEKLSKELEKRGFKAQSIHGDKNHNGRQRALGLFKDNLAQVLVATDVAARGLDIPNVSHVINYDLPATYEDYVHRIGRTGRAGKAGKALTFVDHR
jgi:superfamily II DNA/RNA helicase